MNEANDIVKELEELQSPLAGMPRSMPYAIPAAYFAMLEESIRTGIGAVAEYSLSIPRQPMPYNIPTGYFDTLPEDILAAATMRKQEPTHAYILPEGYFEQFPMQALEAAKRAHAPKEKRIIPLPNKLWKNLRWAAAAVLILGIGFGSYKLMVPNDTMSIEEQLAQLPTGTINEYVQAHIDEFDAEMIASNITATNNSATPAQLEEAEIINYLDETGWDGTTIN